MADRGDSSLAGCVLLRARKIRAIRFTSALPVRRRAAGVVIPGLIALVRRTVFGVEATLGLLMACAGVVGAIVHTWRTRRHRIG